MAEETPEAENPKIQQLQEELQNICKDLQNVRNHNNEILTEYMQQLEQIKDQKLNQLNEWKENEIKSAYKFKEGQTYAIDCDYKQRLEDIKTKVEGLTVFKAKILKEEFPEPLKYFTDKGYDFSFLGLSNNPEKQENGFIDVEETKEQLLTQEEINEDIEQVRKIDDWRPEGVVIGAKISIQMSQMPPLVGTVCSLSEKTFEIKLDSGKIIVISNLAVNSGISVITVQ